MTYTVEFKNGHWGFTIYKGDRIVCESWSVNGFPMAKNPDSEWEQSEVHVVAEETMKEAEALWARLDTLASTP